MFLMKCEACSTVVDIPGEVLDFEAYIPPSWTRLWWTGGVIDEGSAQADIWRGSEAFCPDCTAKGRPLAAAARVLAEKGWRTRLEVVLVRGSGGGAAPPLRT